MRASAISPFCAVLAMLIAACAGSACAQDYDIRLTQMAKVGERYALIVHGHEEQHMSMTVDGQATPAQDEVLSVDLDADVEVLAIGTTGRESRSRFTIRSVTAIHGDHGTASDVLPAGTVFVAERSNGRSAFTIDGAPVQPEASKALGAVIEIAGDESANDDAIFGTRERKQVGDSWPLDADLASAELTKKGLAVTATNVSGSTRLAAVETVAGAQVLTITAAMRLKEVAIPLPPGMTVTSSGFTASFTGRFPADAGKRALDQGTSMDGTIAFAGKAGNRAMTCTMIIKRSSQRTFSPAR